jgi:purine-binding chemotaxis protein CheW
VTDLLLVVTLAGERIAVPAGDVEAVVEVEGLTPVPRAPAHVAGLTALRSRVLTAIDGLASLGFGKMPERATHNAIVVEAESCPYALLVDSVEDVVDFQGEIRAVRTALTGGWARVAKGMVEVGDDLLLLVDTDALLAGPPVIGAKVH